uniref:BRCT domain-containing protein n=1 Tax=Kalanchoe fedtschenkoi TaxID=63787 RepID=A0A7N0UT49_KALFE
MNIVVRNDIHFTAGKGRLLVSGMSWGTTEEEENASDFRSRNFVFEFPNGAPFDLRTPPPHLHRHPLSVDQLLVAPGRSFEIRRLPSMKDSKSGSGAKDAKKRQLPSWMSARDEENDDNKSAEAKSDEKKRKPSTSSDFSKLLEGVVFVLSGFVNPERSTLRSQALAMGAEYQADWNSGCTLLICAFPNTPKFRQVEAECGTIVAKEWISECYQQKKLVDIDAHLMHAGKPWRKSSGVHAVNHAKESSQARNADKAVEKKVQRKAATASSSKVFVFPQF